MTDTTPPTITIISVSKTKLSDESGFTEAVITWKANEDICGYSVRNGGVDQGTGVEVDVVSSSWFPIFPLNLGVLIAAETEIETTVQYTDLDPGENQINIYALDMAGNWVPYMQS